MPRMTIPRTGPAPRTAARGATAPPVGATAPVTGVPAPAAAPPSENGPPPTPDGVRRPAPPAPPAAAALSAYLGADPQPAAAHLVLSRSAARLRGLFTASQREALKIAVTRAMIPVQRRRAAELARTADPLLLNVGSGTYNAAGWVNIDLWGLGRAWGVHPDLCWDLRLPLPFPPGRADAIFMEHVLEHLPADVGLQALRRWHGLLRPGGVVRISVPDVGRYLTSYAGDRRFLEAQRPGRPTPLLAVAEVVYHHGHRSVWDAPTLVALLEAAGFTEVRESAHAVTAAPLVPDSPERAGESLYVEGIRPRA